MSPTKLLKLVFIISLFQSHNKQQEAYNPKHKANNIMIVDKNWEGFVDQY